MLALVVPDLPGNFSSEPRTAAQLRSEIEWLLRSSPNMKRRRLAAKLGISQKDELFQEQLALVERDLERRSR